VPELSDVDPHVHMTEDTSAASTPTEADGDQPLEAPAPPPLSEDLDDA
jgi:hypothetical protein